MAPPGIDDGRTAYLHVLIYDSKRMGLDGTSRPHVTAPYPAVYFDMAYRPMFRKYMGVRFGQHEAGHVLGLCKNADHITDGAHCTNKNCLMVPALHLSIPRWFLGLSAPKQSLCEDCLADIAAAKRRDSQARLAFVGAMLVRQEDGYRVAKLPASTILSFAPIETSELLKAKEVLLLKAAEYPPTHEWQSNQFFCGIEGPTDLTGYRAVLERATRDPDRRAANSAKELLDKLLKQRGEECTVPNENLGHVSDLPRELIQVE